MSLPEHYEDLAQLLTELQGTMQDSRSIWCRLGTQFETTVTHCKGLRIGGAWSPVFLPSPGTLQLSRPRVLFVESALNPVQDWVPLMEGVLRTYESLLVVTDEIDPMLLAAFRINAHKKTLSCCVVRTAPVSGPSWSGGVTAEKPQGPRLSLPKSTFGRGGHRTDQSFGKGRHSPPKQVDGLPLGEEALIRKAAGMFFPTTEEWSASLEDVAVIEVGGDHYEDQEARLRFVNEWLRQQDKRAAGRP
jgi:hypothetical protein